MRVKYVLDVLKPHKPGSSELAKILIKLKGAYSVKIKVDEIDSKTTSIYIAIHGTEDLSLDEIEATLEGMNCSLHSVDEVLMEDKPWE